MVIADEWICKMCKKKVHSYFSCARLVTHNNFWIFMLRQDIKKFLPKCKYTHCEVFLWLLFVWTMTIVNKNMSALRIVNFTQIRDVCRNLWNSFYFLSRSRTCDKLKNNFLCRRRSIFILLWNSIPKMHSALHCNFFCWCFMAKVNLTLCNNNNFASIDHPRNLYSAALYFVILVEATWERNAIKIMMMTH